MANDGYVPPSVQRQMDTHMKNMPANLQKYQSGNTYIPASAVKSMTSYMEKTMPTHMKQYIGAYMEQKVIAGRNSLDPSRTREFQPRAPAPNLMRRDHSAYGQQFTVPIDTSGAPIRTSLSHMPQYSPASKDTATPPPAPPPAPVPNGSQNPYEFILNSGGKPKKQLSSGSFAKRLLISLVGLSMLLILAFVLVGVLGGSGNSSTDQLIKVAEQQAEIVRITGLGKDKASDSTVKNLAITTQLSTQSAEAYTLDYLSKHGHKLSASQLSLLKDSGVDQQLNEAATAGTFDDSFNQILQNKLTSYRADLQAAYQSATGVNERKLLQDSFTSVSYLLGTPKS